METKKLESLISQYSQKDIAISLFALSTWNENRSADLKVKYAYCYFLSCSSFSTDDKIKTYSDFTQFCNALFLILPNFPHLEDFVPEGDWGEIKYFYNENFFHILYGSELDWPYDLLTNFELFYSSLEKEIENLLKENPLIHLNEMLRLSDVVITSLKCNPSSNSTIRPGHLECPKQNYWEECSYFLDSFNNHHYSESFLKRYTMNIGDFSSKFRDANIFIDSNYKGEAFQFMFIQTDSLRIPVSPRWYISVLVDSWNEIFNKVKSSLEMKKNQAFSIGIGLKLGSFASSRISHGRVKFLASAAGKNEEYEDFIFPFVLHSGNSLYFFCLLEPHIEDELIQKNLENIQKGIEATKARLNKELVLMLHLDNCFIEYRDDKINIKFIIVAPPLSTSSFGFFVPRKLDAKLIFMKHLVGIFDELENADQFDNFIEFWNENQDKTLSSAITLEDFGLFVDSDGILTDGATDPTVIHIDPHYGTNFRYRNLVEFWNLYPKINFFSYHPRTWRVSKGTSAFTRLRAKPRPAVSLYFEIGDTSCYINCLFENMHVRTTSIVGVIIDCLADYLLKLELKLKKHDFFKLNKKITIFIYPKSITSNPKSKLNHLKHLEVKANPFSIDFGRLQEWGVFRYVFDDSQMSKVLSGKSGRNGEIEIVKTFLKEINFRIPDLSEYPKIMTALESLSKGRPRHTVFEYQKQVCFPDFIKPLRPEIKHFKIAKKIIAIAAKDSGLEEGKYNLNEAKTKIDILLKNIVSRINIEINRYNIEDALPILLKNIDALVCENEMKSHHHNAAMEMDISYNLGERIEKQHYEFAEMYKNYRYMIEKFVQLQPHGSEDFNEEAFQQLGALIDCFFRFASAGDEIHYGLFSIGLEIDNEYRTGVILAEDKVKERKDFHEYLANRKIGNRIKSSDKVESPTPIDDYLDLVDSAFQKEMGFLFRDLTTILTILETWSYRTGGKEKTFYRASKKEIINICLSEIKDAAPSSISTAIVFLTLRPENLCKIIGKKDSLEIPIWEYYRRHSRYSIRPLIEVGKYIYWGSYSAQRVRFLWTDRVLGGVLPVNLEKQLIEDCLSSEKSKIERELEKKAEEIVQRFTPLCKSNVFLHKRDKSQDYPQKLGDFDVLAFFEDRNIILSVECKHLKQVFSLKDSKDLKEELFGRNSIEGSYVGKIIRRDTFLKNNLGMIAQTFNWKLNENTVVISVFCSKEPYPWTFSPPMEVPVKFVCIDELDDFLSSLNTFEVLSFNNVGIKKETKAEDREVMNLLDADKKDILVCAEIKRPKNNHSLHGGMD